MKGLGKVLFSIGLLTGALLLYVHEQVEVLRISYRIHERSTDLTRRAEEFRRLRYEVDQLRSPQSLERKLQHLPLSLTLPKEIQVLRVSAPIPSVPVGPLPLRSPASSFLDFFGQWIQVAQARTEQ